MGNIEEDIKVLKNIQKLRRIEFKHCVTDREERALENILAEREQNKKRIEELEEKNKHLKYVYDDCCKCLLDTIEKQKVKNRIKENKKLIDETYSEDIIQKLTDENEILEELLEDK